MWEQYKKTVVGMQLSIAVMTGASYMLAFRSLAPAAMFFAVMQIGAVFGAYWGARLRNRSQSRAW
jgi:hypothetical protein